MTKIVYNACYGGFSLSHEAVLLGRKLSGDPAWGDDYGARDISRTDQYLIAVVETLGSAANGRCAHLAIRELDPGTLYRIDEYDGNESVVTQSEYDWGVA